MYVETKYDGDAPRRHEAAVSSISGTGRYAGTSVRAKPEHPAEIPVQLSWDGTPDPNAQS